MKYLLIATFLMSSVLFQLQDIKIKGKYKIEYDYSYGSQNGIINFEGETYTRKQTDGKKVKGNVDYQQYFIMLNDKDSNLQVKFSKREIGNDTIFFRTTDLSNNSDNNEQLKVYGGRLIKIKLR